MRGNRRRKLHFSKIYSFTCGKASFKGDENSQIGGPGFSRVVYCNEPDSFEAKIHNYGDNYVRTTKYTLATFLPKSLFEQFRRVANFFFLVTGTLSFTPLAPYTAVSAIFPLIIVVAATMIKEGIEDVRRKKQDLEVNNRKVKVHKGDGVFDYTEWKGLRVGDVVKVEKDEFFPADLLLLSSSYEDAVCYVETMNLDGETNLKLKQALEVTSLLHEDFSIRDFTAIVKCEDPNANLYSFVGGMEIEEQQYPLSPQQLLLRDSKLRNTDYVYGVVVFTGHDTKSTICGNLSLSVSPNAIWLFIPISLYVSVEIVKVLQSIFINQDIHMYYEEADKPAHARTSNLNEELGQVDTILSDKTGTLTCNSMEFIKCSVAGTAYGRGSTEVERAIGRRKGSPLVHENLNGENHMEDLSDKKPPIKGFNFKDERIMDGNWVNEPNAVSYEAESPDEAAFVIAARELGFEFYKRTQTSISLHEFDPVSRMKVERSYKLLNVLEFNSSRKRMSVIVRNEEGKIILFSKGADSVMFERLAENGLRTLIIAYRELGEEEYREFDEKFTLAKNSVSADRETLIDEVAQNIERDLILLGATAVEDKLQNGVPDCIDKLAQAGIKIWVLTGDKMETAINIGFSCSLLRQGMKQIYINLDTPEIQALEKAGEKAAIAKILLLNGYSLILSFCLSPRSNPLGIKGKCPLSDKRGKAQLNASKGSSEAFALIIDGKSLTYALDDDVKKMFLELAICCASVICCRSSPKQKALVTRLVKSGTGKTTLAIGDGANDVGMLQEADIGVGISGVEGMQAVMSSDIAIAQFRYLERLLLVHGHWCYRRVSSMICYFFYKNIVFGFSLFLYEANASFSAQPAYNDWFCHFIMFSSHHFRWLPWEFLTKMYLLGFASRRSSECTVQLVRILSWMFNGLCSAIIIFFFCTRSLEAQAFNQDGKTAGRDILGATIYTCIVWTVNLQMALAISYFTLIQHIVIWGSIVFWYIFLLAYGALTPSFSTNAYKVFIEALAPAPFYWIITLLVVITTLIPYFSYTALQMRFFPMYHGMIQWIRYEGRSNDPEYCNMVRQRSIRPTTVGFTARVAAGSSRVKDRTHNHQ
ncbi:hypothetical protein FNV43_RR27007 [Rhamnella rubrinervis]|uniref:Phospholipid-transporting ATPase n=1 Tax=Rhamnella rubrinervis TaxID=2594499 RepID=A0A8K0GPR3_9ROSA|nr:hypothetical protein FNV43_RR27007 [Rhamnella rubrinervis]